MSRGRAQLLLAALALAACAQVRARRTTGSAPVARARASELIFSHAKHAAEGAACEACHAGMKQAESLAQRQRPTHASCEECHAEVKDRGKCGRCHRDLARAGKARRAPTPGLRFSHKRHLAGAKAAKEPECVLCHAGAAVATSVEGIARPKMRGDCLGCHDHIVQYRELRCRTCHQSFAELPLRMVSQFNHDGDFVREHRRVARGAGQDLCASCHAQSFCADCHGAGSVALLPGARRPERADREFIHRGDWRTRHSIESRANPGACTRCHSPKSCDACHRSQGVSGTLGAVAGSGARSPHPSDWLSPSSPNSHGGEARRRITQCAGCHDQGAQSSCIRCHRTAAKGGLGVKPHPPGWKRSGKKDNPMCRYCH
jgi:hypothetical protein